MATPEGTGHFGGRPPVEATAPPAPGEAALGRFWLVARALAAPHAPATLPQLEHALATALAAGARPFEIIAGAPAARYGARVTFEPGGDREALARAFGLEDHPWGAPAFVGARVRDGVLHAKAYHLPRPLDGGLGLPDGLPEGLRLVMMAQGDGATEAYFRLLPACPWGPFAASCAGLLAVTDLPPFAPRPRPAEGGFCVSLRWQGDRLSAVTLLASGGALRDDASVERAWAEGLSEGDLRAYEHALAAARSLGRLRSGAFHAMLGWTFEATGEQHRAVSLAVPI